MSGVSRRTHPLTPAAWRIRSVSVRARDGPQRLDQIYRLLVVEPVVSVARGAPPPDPATVLEEREEAHARRHLRPCVD
jgi:hypothetical protein